MFHKATKIVLIVEQLLRDKVCAVAESEGATGYTVIDCSGKGAHGVHAGGSRAAVVQGFSLSRIEVIVTDRSAAERIAETVAMRYFKDQSGVVYIDEVEILRPDKF
jgi:nitrogen regulatory protein PII